MSDLISRQAAIRAVCERECQELKSCAGECPSIWALESLPSVEQERKTERWIPCSERLPEKYGWYQVTLKDGRVSRLYYDYKGDRWIDNVRKHMFELYDIYSKITHKRITEENEDVYWDDWVVAWMPLPPSYRGENDG